MSYETRKLPKKTVITISVLIFLGIVVYFFIDTMKNEKFKEVLADLGHKDIKNLKVINRLNVEDVVTKNKSYVYKLAFYDNSLNKECVGFVYQAKDKTYTKDLDCK